jgi:two-component system, sensor histidine kinase
MTTKQVHALIIDDDLLNLEVLSRLLALENATSTEVQDPTQLAGMLDNLPSVDVVFLDLEMPVVDGYRVLDYLKNTIGMTIPIVAYTVHISEANTAREVGFDSFLCKPLNADAFSEHFRRIMKHERVWITQTRG